MKPYFKLKDNINIYKLNWYYLSSNPNAIDLLMKNPDKINWTYLSQNENAIDLLMNNYDKIDWSYLSQNENAIDLLMNNYDKIDWSYLSYNNNAYKILKNNMDKIDENLIHYNENYFLIYPPENEEERLYIEAMIRFNNRITYNSKDLEYELLLKDPSIFIYDYEEMKNNFKELGEEIIQKALHPKRMLKLMETYGEDLIYDCYFD